MNHDQAKGLIKGTFENPFDKNRFTYFGKNLLNRIEESPFTYPTQYIKESFKPYINSMERIGKYSDGSADIDILIVKLQKETTLERARTAQRNYIASYLNGSRGGQLKDAALVAYVSPEEEDWRFSLVKMDYRFEQTPSGKMKVKEEFTPARRWSFLVGANEKSHTAQSRFIPFLTEDSKKPQLDELAGAFNIETVTKEFFEKYRNLFVKIKLHLDAILSKDPGVKADFKAKGIDTVNFSKKLMGQIVFLYFLQKKGWFGVGKDKAWGTGSRNFLRDLLDKKHGNYRNFFNDMLEPLFYEALRTDRSDYKGYYRKFDCKIPFLNGGLFDPIGNYDWKKTEVILPNDLFSNDNRTKEGDTGDGIFDIFDRFNFTVREDEPLDKEVAIDPELLGKAYEKFNAIRPDNFDEYYESIGSVKENKFNKEFGVYYTPREIVHYMCQKSLEYYLKEEFRDKIPEADMEDFVSKVESVLEKESLYQQKKKENEEAKPKVVLLKDSIYRYLNEIDEKLANIRICDPAVGSGAFPVGLMNEIVRLRSAIHILSTGTIPPLYDIKRNCIERSIYGVDIDEGAIEIARLRLWLSLVVDEDDIRNIKPLPNLDYKLVRGNSLLGVEKNIHTKPMLDELEEIKARHFNETDPTRKKEEAKKISDLICQITDGHKEFDFEIYFSEVFKEKKGFDVVIANPPYVSVEKYARTAQQALWKKTFKTFAARGDIYCFFYERGIGLLRNGGVLTYISSNKYQRTGYGKGLRQLLASNRIRTLIDFCELPVFEAATDPMIVILNKGAAPPAHQFPVVVIKSEREMDEIAKTIAERSSRYKPEQLKEEGWSLEGGDGLALVEKLREIGVPLIKYVNNNFYRGILTGLNEAFVVDKETHDYLIKEDRKSAKVLKPWIRGMDIKRWHYIENDLWVIQIESSENKKHPWSGASEREAAKIFKKEYPAVAHHLFEFEDSLRQRTDKGKYYWELRSCDYWDNFAHPKIFVADIGKILKATWYTPTTVIGNTGYLIPDCDKSLLCVLLSTVVDWYARMTFQGLGDPWTNGRMRFINRSLSTIPIPHLNGNDKSRLSHLADRAAKEAGEGNKEALRKIEREIDDIVYGLYEISKGERDYIENALANVRREATDDTGDGDE